MSLVCGWSGLRLHCKAIEAGYCRDRVSQFDKRAEWRLWHRLSSPGRRWHSTALCPGSAESRPTFNGQLSAAPPPPILANQDKVWAPSTKFYLPFFPTHDPLVFADNSSSWLQLPWPPSLFLSRSPFPRLYQCNPWQWKATPPLSFSNPPSKSEFNCLWHHVWLLWATRQSGRDCGVQRASTNSLPLFFPSLWLFHTRSPSPSFFLQSWGLTTRELLRPIFPSFFSCQHWEISLSLSWLVG